MNHQIFKDTILVFIFNFTFTLTLLRYLFQVCEVFLEICIILFFFTSIDELKQSQDWNSLDHILVSGHQICTCSTESGNDALSVVWSILHSWPPPISWFDSKLYCINDYSCLLLIIVFCYINLGYSSKIYWFYIELFEVKARVISPPINLLESFEIASIWLFLTDKILYFRMLHLN